MTPSVDSVEMLRACPCDLVARGTTLDDSPATAHSVAAGGCVRACGTLGWRRLGDLPHVNPATADDSVEVPMPHDPADRDYDGEHLFDPVAIERGPFDAEFQGCSLGGVSSSDGFSVAGLFAGIGGIELGLSRSGGEAEFL